MARPASPVGAQEAAHIGQRVEKEVRLDLRLQDLQPPRRELALQRIRFNSASCSKAAAFRLRRRYSPSPPTSTARTSIVCSMYGLSPAERCSPLTSRVRRPPRPTPGPQQRRRPASILASEAIGAVAANASERQLANSATTATNARSQHQAKSSHASRKRVREEEPHGLDQRKHRKQESRTTPTR